MRKLLAALLFMAAAASACPAFAGSSLDADTRHYLEGVWLIGRAPPSGACVDNRYVDYQLEFEFERTGGRVLSFEPFDLFSAAPILDATRKGDTISVTIAALATQSSHKMSLRILGPDRMELVMDLSTYADGRKPRGSDMLYRCGVPDKEFSRGVPNAVLNMLTPPETAGSAFIMADPGQSDADVCWPKEDSRRLDPRWIRFEVHGPAHFFVMGYMAVKDQARRDILDLSPLRHIRVTGDHSLQLEGALRLEGSVGWNGGAQVKPFFLDIDWTATRIHIAQLDATFVNCVGVMLAGAKPPE